MQIINNTPPDSGLGDTLYEAFNKVNANFAKLVDTDVSLQIELDALEALINSNTVLNHNHTVTQINGLQAILNSKLDVSTFNSNIIAINASIQALNELIAILVNTGGITGAKGDKGEIGITGANGTNGENSFKKLSESERLALNSPILGLHIYQTDNVEGVYVNKSSGWVFAY
jgi:hypothetical protein